MRRREDEKYEDEKYEDEKYEEGKYEEGQYEVASVPSSYFALRTSYLRPAS